MKRQENNFLFAVFHTLSHLFHFCIACCNVIMRDFHALLMTASDGDRGEKGFDLACVSYKSIVIFRVF